jgi:dienelactone hydrolase
MCLLLLFGLVSLGWADGAGGRGTTAPGLADQLRALDGHVFSTDSPQAQQLPRMLALDIQARIRSANQRDREAWHAIHSRADWERFRQARLEALRQSLGPMPPLPKDLHVQITETCRGAGYRIENLVFVSRPGLVVTANLYSPEPSPPSMPGLLICHSHHNPKTQEELQDMGVTWARQGCRVLIMDLLGHGERRQHPFRDPSSYQHPFRVGRQDYYFRYNTGIQLQVLGDSLMGWMVWDVSRGVDLLLARPDTDKKRIVVLGSVAGGGDVAAVAAALDPRISALVAFNFGGPQPETPYPLPADAEVTFNYAGSGSWESTRNLYRSGRDGFLPWMIVGSVAPRRLLYGHEFSWDREHDPVWARLTWIYDLYAAPDHLAASQGRGRLVGRPPESTHCDNLGPVQRRGIYTALNRWFGIPVPAHESHEPRPAAALQCLTPSVAAALQPRPLYALASDLGEQRLRSVRAQLSKGTQAQQHAWLRREWALRLGDVEPARPTVLIQEARALGDVTLERLALQAEPGVVVPLLLLLPSARTSSRLPVVVAVAQGGKQGFLHKRAHALAGLLQGGMAVCLPDLRGTGESQPVAARGRTAAITDLSSSELLLGRTLVGSRLKDLRAVLHYLRSRKELDCARLGLWGDSFAPANPAGRSLAVPLDAEPFPELAEPLGGLLALFGALYEEEVRAVYVRGGLLGYQSLLESPFCYQPHDMLVPGALTAGDLCDVAAVLAPRPLRLQGLVDGLNRRVAVETIQKAFAPARAAYRSGVAEGQFSIEAAETDEGISPFFRAGLATLK